jgi:hypothetical protein
VGLSGSPLLIEHGSRRNILECLIAKLQILVKVGGVFDAKPDDGCGDEDRNSADTELAFFWLARRFFSGKQCLKNLP